MDFYAVLGIPRDADEQTIRDAYRMLARRYHPDRGLGSSAEKFRLATEAYETLVHGARRRAYDLSLERARRAAPVQPEPLAGVPSPLRREDPAVFGRFGRASQRSAVRPFDELDKLLDQWLHSFDEWPW